MVKYIWLWSFSFKITCNKKKTEEEEEEEDGVQENGILPRDDLESYEIKAERVLEEQRERVSIAPELDYIDEEDEDAQPQVWKCFDRDPSAVLGMIFLMPAKSIFPFLNDLSFLFLLFYLFENLYHFSISTPLFYLDLPTYISLFYLHSMATANLNLK